MPNGNVTNNRWLVVILVLCVAGISVSCVQPKRVGPSLLIQAEPSWEAEHGLCVSTVVFSPDSGILASTGPRGTVKLWHAQSGKPIRTLEGHKGVILSAAFSSSGRILASGGMRNPPTLWDVSSGKMIRQMMGKFKNATSVDLSPDGSVLASGGKNVYLWDISTGNLKRTLKSDADFIVALRFSPNGKTLAAGRCDRRLMLLDSHTGALKWVMEGYRDFPPAFSPDGRRLAVVNLGAKVGLWDAQTGQSLGRKVDWKKVGYPLSVAFSPDGKLLASGGERLRWQGKVLRKRAIIGGAVMISDADTGERLWYKQFRKSRVWSVAFSPDGKLLAAGFDNGIVKVWRIRYTEKPSPR